MCVECRFYVSVATARSLITIILVFSVATRRTETSTLSLHDALPIFVGQGARGPHPGVEHVFAGRRRVLDDDAALGQPDRKSTRLNPSHVAISYAVFCLKKKNAETVHMPRQVPTSSANSSANSCLYYK